MTQYEVTLWQKEQLQEWISGLQKFIYSDEFNKIDPSQQALFILKFRVMCLCNDTFSDVMRELEGQFFNNSNKKQNDTNKRNIGRVIV